MNIKVENVVWKKILKSSIAGIMKISIEMYQSVVDYRMKTFAFYCVKKSYRLELEKYISDIYKYKYIQ